MTLRALVLMVAVTVVPQAAPAEIEREARAIEAMLVAPCCYSQQVSIHESAAADEVRRDVRARLTAGQSRQRILDDYVANYGKRILAVPPARGFDLTLFVTPVVAHRRFGLRPSPSAIHPLAGRVPRPRTG
jgi:cytochrome c-type biogenesis protein CcmH/NrfF